MLFYVLSIIIDILGWSVIFLSIYYVIWCIGRIPYRLFCSFWWKDLIDPWTYYHEIEHAYQRIKYGVSDHDIWNFDEYLLDVLIRGLKRLRHNTLAPNLTDEDWYALITGIKEFKHVYKCYEHSCNHESYYKNFKKAMDLLTKHFTGLWL